MQREVLFIALFSSPLKLRISDKKLMFYCMPKVTFVFIKATWLNQE